MTDVHMYLPNQGIVNLTETIYQTITKGNPGRTIAEDIALLHLDLSSALTASIYDENPELELANLAIHLISTCYYHSMDLPKAIADQLAQKRNNDVS